MEFIKGITFSPFSPKGSLSSKEAKNSLKNLIEGTGANYIVLVPNALQETPQSEEIDFTSDATVSDKELISMINHIHKEGLHVFLKPTVNCKNGTWRAHINFLMKMFPVSPNGATGLHPIRNFSFTLLKLPKKPNVKFSVPAVRW